jgi:hypothetical protein
MELDLLFEFLWNGKDGDSAKAKIAWSDVCFPKKEGSWLEKFTSLE